MLFSVIIPTCNRNDLLGLCLDKLAPGNQTLKDHLYEVIVTDDSGSSETERLIEESYHWVRYRQGPRQGPAANRNKGAGLAVGKWLVFLDDDCLPDKYLLTGYESAVRRSANFKTVFEGCILNQGIPRSPVEYAPNNTNGGNLWSCNFCIERNIFFQLGGFDENFRFPHLEDSDLKRRIDNLNIPIKFVSDAIVLHPWRKIENGYRLGAFQEMFVYYSIKHKVPLSLWKLLSSIFFTHYNMIRGKKISSEHITAVKIMVQHLLVVLLNFNKWKTKYVERCKS